jgi:hypothetical protein
VASKLFRSGDAMTSEAIGLTTSVRVLSVLRGASGLVWRALFAEYLLKRLNTSGREHRMPSVYRQFQAVDETLKQSPRRTLVFESSRSTPRARCRCGKCRECKDNARWEQIFREKFADPDYYKERAVSHGSSLSWLR